jgi:VWFA-related protein
MYSALALLPLFLGFGAHPQSQQTQQSSEVPQSATVPRPGGESPISVRSDLVILPVKVTDSDGVFVSGLNQSNFRVFENGREQKITNFQKEDAPVTVGLIVDHSQSMGPKLTQVAAAVAAFAKTSNPQDEMFVIDFNDHVIIELLHGQPFSSDPDVLGQAVQAVAARGRTALYDAVAEGIYHFRYGHWDKRALIVVSDGEDNASRIKLPQLETQAQQAQVQIYSVGLVGSDEELENPGALKRLSKTTGGMAYFPDPEHVGEITTEIAKDLREQYTIGYVPEKAVIDHSFRKIEVRVTAPGRDKLRVRTKPGYAP